MKPLNVREWLQARRLEGCEYADQLLDLVEGEDEANENAAAIADLWPLAPDKVQKSKEQWRLVEFVRDELALLDEVRDIAEEFGEGVTTGNGRKPHDVADKLRAMFDSGRWLEHDL
jgi:hypothetical protein